MLEVGLCDELQFLEGFVACDPDLTRVGEGLGDGELDFFHFCGDLVDC